MILAVLMGLGMTSLIYMGIDAGLHELIKDVSITPYMPDQLLKEASPALIRSILVSAVTIGIFLPVSIRVFDKKDVK